MTEDRAFNRPALYNPALWSKNEVKAYFVARQGLLGRFIDDLRREKPGGRPQHRLILGLRGMGKSTLLRRIAIAIEEDESLNAQWLPLTFPEEQYNVANLADLWLNCLDALGDLLEARGDKQGVARIDAEVERLDRQDPETTLQALLRAARGMDRRLLLLVDNIDLVLDRLKKQDWPLREILQAHPEILLIGASARAMEATYDYGAAFYDFFKVDELRGLTEQEMRETILNLARLRGVEEQIRRAVEEPGRLSVLHTLTGGNPRTAVLLYGVLLKGVGGDVRTDLEGLLDEVTPLYKARFEELPVLSQQLLDKLALYWDPVTARQLADLLGWEVNLVSAQLSRLQDTGVVEKVKAGKGKRAAFQVGERFFNIWYLMRASRRVRRKLIWLVEFLRAFYSAEELKKAAREKLSGKATGERDVEFILALSRAMDKEPLGRALETFALESLFSGELKARIGEILDLKGEDSDLMPKAERIEVLQKIKRELPEILKKAKVRFSIPEFVEMLLGLPISAEQKQELVNILASVETLETLSQLREQTMLMSQVMESQIGKTTYAKLAQAIACGEMRDFRDIPGGEAAAARFSWSLLALIPKLLENTFQSSSEVEYLLQEGIALEPDAWIYWYGLALLIDKQSGREQEVERALRRSVELAPERPEVWKTLGKYLSRQTDPALDTEAVLRKAYELAQQDSEILMYLAIYLAKYRKAFSKASDILEKILKISPNVWTARALAAGLLFLQAKNERALAHIPKLLLESHEGDGYSEMISQVINMGIQADAGPELLAIFDASEAAQRWRPLREALAAAVAGDPDLLNGVAPEVRGVAQAILKEIAPDLMDDHS